VGFGEKKEEELFSLFLAKNVKRGKGDIAE